MIRIESAEDCCGCHACQNACPVGCISMVEDREGFLYPQVDITICVDCGICNKVCPMTSEPGTGEEPLAFAVWHKNTAIRTESSSGGVFNALMVSTLSQNGIVFGAAFDDSLLLCHQAVSSEAESIKLRGSKYLQSRIGSSYQEAKDFLKQGRRVLFSGTPCQIAGLYSYLGRDDENLLTCDLVCHGVPSPKVFALYVAAMEQRHGAKVEKVAFRQKAQGWKKFSVVWSFDNKTEYCKVFSVEPYMIGFLKNIDLRPSCHSCRFSRLPRVADITLGDFWGVGTHHPEWDDDKGTSLILVQTEKGKRGLEACRNSLVIHEADFHMAKSSNPCICGFVPPAELRSAFFNDLERLSFEKVMKKYMLPPPVWHRLLAFPRRLIQYAWRRF